MPDPRKILILFAHPSQNRSEVNMPMVKAIQDMDNVTLVDLYQEYPTFRINIDKEQERLLAHDVVIMMFPLYWYSTPAILKEWQDLVLEYGFAYGHDGTALQGKIMLCAITAGGAEHMYRADGVNHYTIAELLRPLEQMSRLTGFHWIAPFALFGARTAHDDGRVPHHVEEFKTILSALQTQKIDFETAEALPKLNGHCDQAFLVNKSLEEDAS